MKSPAEQLRKLLAQPGILMLADCHDAISAKQVELMGFASTFMSGFAVSAARLGIPDTGLISFAELVERGGNAPLLQRSYCFESPVTL